jgi:hypothetical protein
MTSLAVSSDRGLCCRLGEKLEQLDVAGDAPPLIESQRLGDSSITRIDVAVDIGESLFVGVDDFEAAV